LTEKQKQEVRNAKTLGDLYNVIKRDYYITTPCHSLRTGSIMEGTRLTIQYHAPDGYEFSIRTPGTPPRWIDYDCELTYVFNMLVEEARKENMDLDRVSELILTVTFYWYNFMPLSRGTAACGVIAMVAMFLAVGIKINGMVPEEFLVDWEGILRPHPQEFIDSLKPWLYPMREKVDKNDFESLPKVDDVFPTIRAIIEGLNCEDY